MAPAKEKFSIYVDETQQINLATAPQVINPPQAPQVPQAQNFPRPVSTQESHLPLPKSELAQIAEVKKGSPARFKPDNLKPNERYYFDAKKVYPPGGERSSEELRLKIWMERVEKQRSKQPMDDIIRENEELKQKVMQLQQQLNLFMQQVQEGQFRVAPPVSQQPQMHQYEQHQAQSQIPISQKPLTYIQQPQAYHQGAPQFSSNIPNATGMPGSNSRQSLLPQCIQPTQTLEFNETSIYGAMSNAPSVVQDLWSGTFACNDKFTVPIDQTEYIRDNIPTSTPAAKRPANAGDENRRSSFQRRISRQSVDGSPLGLSPIVETSRECNSKSSSSSSAMSTTPGTTHKSGLTQPTVTSSEVEKPIDPSDITSYKRLVDKLTEPLSRRIGYFKIRRNLPPIKPDMTCVRAGSDEYFIVGELSAEDRIYTAIIMDNNSNESSTNIPAKKFCVKVDQPPNEWLFYICNELQRRLAKGRCKPDIELSIMNANPAIIYNNGSILIDEHSGKATLAQLLEACKTGGKEIPKPVSAFMALELLLIIKQMHACGVIHMNIKPTNVVINSCPSREDILSINERTSVLKLTGFDRSMDMRLLPPGTTFNCTLKDLTIGEMHDSKPWSWQIDWFGALDCIHQMMFGEPMNPVKTGELWTVRRSFDGLPSKVWEILFKKLLNMNPEDSQPIEDCIEDLGNWVKANNNFILQQVSMLDEFFGHLRMQDQNTKFDNNQSSVLN